MNSSDQVAILIDRELAEQDHAGGLSNVPERNLRIQKWLNEQSWPHPRWLDEDQQSQEHRHYRSYFTHLLRCRYFELETDFRTLVPVTQGTPLLDISTAEHLFNLLQLVKSKLEHQKPDLLEISYLLDCIERYMPWITPPQVLLGRMHTILSRLQLCMKTEAEQMLAAKIGDAVKITSSQYWSNMDEVGEIRGLLDEAIGIVNSYTVQAQMSDGLQIERLKTLCLSGSILLMVLLGVSPLITNIDSITSGFSLGLENYLVAWAASAGITVIGATGGFLSGLLQTRESRVTLTDYEEGVLKFHLKLTVGALLGLLLFILLSWQILPGIIIENLGSYVLFAFLVGFSERYFLKLLNLEPDEHQDSNQEQTPNPSGA
jgi:hypothetical protein